MKRTFPLLFTLVTEQEKLLPFYVTGIGIQKNQEHILRKEGFNFYQLAFCSSGEGTFFIRDKQFSITEGMGFFFYPDIPHEYYAVKEPWEIYWITFGGNSIHSTLNYLKLNEYEILINTMHYNFIDELVDISITLNSDSPYKAIQASSLLYELIIKTKEHSRISSPQQINKMFQLQPVINYMEQNFHKYSSLEEMSAIINITPHHLCRLFKQVFGMSPFSYLTKIRMQHAKQLLMEKPNIKVLDIAKYVGYDDTSYFCAIFKRNEGYSPMEFRKMHGRI
jgi:AraC-like DNA-binding protein